jgi:hypothetical protein
MTNPIGIDGPHDGNGLEERPVIEEGIGKESGDEIGHHMAGGHAERKAAETHIIHPSPS